MMGDTPIPPSSAAQSGARSAHNMTHDPPAVLRQGGCLWVVAHDGSIYINQKGFVIRMLADENAGTRATRILLRLGLQNQFRHCDIDSTGTLFRLLSGKGERCFLYIL